jgi:hypothetical protein
LCKERIALRFGLAGEQRVEQTGLAAGEPQMILMCIADAEADSTSTRPSRK